MQTDGLKAAHWPLVTWSLRAQLYGNQIPTKNKSSVLRGMLVTCGVEHIDTVVTAQNALGQRGQVQTLQGG